MSTMLFNVALMSMMKVVLMILIILMTGMETAPTERGFAKLPHPPPSLTQASTLPDKPSGLNPSQYLKHWFLSTKSGTPKLADGTTAGTITAAIKAGRLKTNPGTVGLDKRAQMLKMISALEELHKTFNSTLSSRITIIPRAHGRNSGKKNKSSPAAAGGKQTTATPAVNSAASKTSADVIIPSLTGRNFRKSLPPQTKRTNKRVCFWKYCSQN
ncbi:urotensin II-related peptide [Cheilinus undulatus]|uniref:urotensin II-related peptide n=1 Tax=Cheilinus undulatus TaxID=241271 RepID=UPI001BD59205|nr:urotensin II-related peptide [Cheilinus undulatus]